MASAWPEIDELIRALADVCALPRSEEEPSLSQATIAVGKATAELTRAAGARGRAAAAARARAASSIEEARAAVEHARRTIAASARRTSGARAASAPDGPPVAGKAEATCPACGRPFVVRYLAATKTPTVAFPVACPVAACEGITSVEYPASAVDVNVDAAPA